MPPIRAFRPYAEGQRGSSGRPTGGFNCRENLAAPSPDATASLQEALLDAALVRRFKAGDQAAFAEIVTRHRGKMLSIALRPLRNHADAEEIAQDAFIRAPRGPARFHGDSSLASRLHRIAFNLSCSRYWHFSRCHRHETRAFDCTVGDDSKATFADLVAGDVPDPTREAANREFFAHVTVCMGKLGAHQREILTLRNLLDRSYEEIAETLGLSPGTVKSRIARARKKPSRASGPDVCQVRAGHLAFIPVV